MLFLIALALAFGFAFFCRKPLKKLPYIFYISAVVITVIISTAEFRNLPVFLNNAVGLFSRGAFATALWCVVMWTGAFPNGSKLIKSFMPIRGELSILAAILTLGHNIGYGKTYFVRLFTDAERMSSNHITASIFTIIMLVIMIPLTVISFPEIRKKMSAKLWKKIQRSAYVFYALIYMHIMVLYLPMAKAGREGYFFSILVYSIVFIGYAICRIRKWIILRKKPENHTVLNVICIILFLISVTVAGVISRQDRDKNNQVSNVVTTVSTVTTAPTTSTISTTSITSTTSTTIMTSTTSTVTTEITSETSDSTTSTTIIQIPEESEEIIYTEEEINPSLEEPVEIQEVTEEINYEQEITDTQPTEPSYIYKNGTYSGSAYGYDGDVYVSVTIENDIITAISGYTDESDSWYYESAQGSVISQILSSQSTSVDAYSGATYTSNAIMSAVQNALDSARN